MPDGDPAAPFVFLGEIADQQRVEMLGRGAAVDMHVDIGIELARQFEDAMDLGGAVAVVAGRRADDPGAVLQRLDHQLVGAGIVGQAFLRHDAELDVDRPLVLVDERLDALEAAHPDLGIDLAMGAHAGGAVADAFLDGRRGPLEHVLDRHRVLDRRHALHGEVRHALGVVFAAAEDAGLVEMDMGIDEAGADEAAVALELFPGAAAQLRRYGRDAALHDADVRGRLIGRTVGEPHIAQDKVEIHHHSSRRRRPARMLHYAVVH